MPRANTEKVEIDIKDYIKDTRLLELNERGGWVELILYMSSHEPKGEISGSYPFFAKVMSCEEKEAKGVIERLIREKICNYELLDDQKMKLISRRMKRKLRKQSKGGESKEPSTHVRCKELYIEYAKNVDIECNWDVKYAVCLNKIIEKLKSTITTRGKVDLSDENILTAFSHILQKIPDLKDFFKRMNLPQINTHYDSIISEILRPAKKSKGHDNFDPDSLAELIDGHIAGEKR